MTLGLNINNLAKLLRTANNDDCLTLQATEDANVLRIIVESSHTEKVSR